MPQDHFPCLGAPQQWAGQHAGDTSAEHAMLDLACMPEGHSTFTITGPASVSQMVHWLKASSVRCGWGECSPSDAMIGTVPNCSLHCFLWRALHFSGTSLASFEVVLHIMPVRPGSLANFKIHSLVTSHASMSTLQSALCSA